MPKYYEYRVDDYYLYFTSHCTSEPMHVHANSKNLTEAGSAKFFVCADGSTVVVKKGRLSSKSIAKIQRFIKANFLYMYNIWVSNGGRPEFYKQ